MAATTGERESMTRLCACTLAVSFAWATAIRSEPTPPPPCEELRRPFGGPKAPRHWARDRAYDLRHVVAALTLDVAAREIRGEVWLQLASLRDALRSVSLDAAELTVNEADDGGTPVAFHVEPERLLVTLARPLARGEMTTLRVRYAARPRRGLYFVGPDAAYPDKPLQAWTQGEPEETRYWLPIYDFPNDKTTSELAVTVPEPMQVISNGRLVGVEPGPQPGWRTYRWRQEVPHSTYLFSIVAGVFDAHRDETGGVPLEFYVPPGTDPATVQRSFARTADMLLLFSELADLPYPFAKYAQTTVEDFLWGGMENTSATTLYRDALHDEAAEPNFTSEGLVAHELAHQWWGDLLTCRDWAHIWLNESFATFFADLWFERRYGRDEYDYRRWLHLQDYLEEDREAHRRPIVWPQYEHPLDVFDEHAYPKGALVLAMLRAMLGDDRFFLSLRHYAKTHAGGNVVTEDLRRSFADTAGAELDAFFEQWLYRAGHPEFFVSARWDPEAGAVRLRVEQRQQPRECTPVFRGPIEVEVVDDEGARRFSLLLEQRQQEALLPISGPPRWIRFDADQSWIKTLEFPKSEEELERLAREDPQVIGRIWAGEQLVRRLDQGADGALARVIQAEPFYGVRAALARNLGKADSAAAIPLLTALAADPDARVRERAASALGDLAEKLRQGAGPAGGEHQGVLARIATALRKLAREESKVYVAAAALEALGKADPEGSFAVLEAALARSSHREILRQGALRGLGYVRDARALARLLEWTAYGKAPRAREAAIAALGKAGRDQPRVRERLEALLDDPYVWARREAAKALGELCDPRSAAALRALAARETERRVQWEAEKALEKCAAPAASPAPP